MYISYIGLFIFAITFFIAVILGITSLPRWAAIFNIIPLFLIIDKTKPPVKGNIAGAVMFLGLILLI